MARRSSLLALAVLLVAAGCASESSEAGSASDDLVGGELAMETDFPSTVTILGSCTAAKVGPRHILTAAHCAFQPGEPQMLYPGGEIKVSTQRVISADRAAAAAAAARVVIERVLVPPSWQGPQAYARFGRPDVAVLLLTEESAPAIAAIPEAQIDARPIAPGDDVFVMGSGCEHGLYPSPETPVDATRRLKVQRLQSLTRAEAFASDDPTGTRPAGLEASYFFTPGVARDPSAASLCPGDSGGPVYRDDGGQRTIVGVNASYNFQPDDPVRISYANWHTRLDREAGEDIGQWVADAVAGRDVETGQPACPVKDAVGAVSFAWQPPVVTRGSCSEDDIAKLAPLLEGAPDEAVRSLQKTLAALSKSCLECAISSRSEPNWQPVLYEPGDGWIDSNQQACNAAIEGRACGFAMADFEACTFEACAQCRVDGSDQERCIAEAAYGACAPRAAVRARSCPALSTTNTTRCASLLDAVRVVCGS